VDSHIISFYSI